MNDNIQSINVNGTTYTQEKLQRGSILIENNQFRIEDEYGSQIIQISNITSFRTFAKKIRFIAPSKYNYYLAIGIVCLLFFVCCGGGGIISSVNYNSNANSIAYGKIAIALISLILLGSGVFLIVYSLRKKMEYPITVIIYQLYITMNAGTSQKITSLDWDDIEKIFDRLYMIIYKNQEKLQPLKVVFNNNNYGQICSSFGNSTMNPRFSNRNI